MPVFKILLLTITSLVYFYSNSSEELLEVFTNQITVTGEATITMDGETFTLENLNIDNASMTLLENEIRYYFSNDDCPVSMNLNLHDMYLLEKGSAVYIMPGANKDMVTIDLNFFNKNWEGKRINKKILFRKGRINLDKVTKRHLEMSFNGEGGPMMSKETFPIKGSLTISF